MPENSETVRMCVNRFKMCENGKIVLVEEMEEGVCCRRLQISWKSRYK